MRSRGDPDPTFGLKGLPSGVESLGEGLVLESMGEGLMLQGSSRFLGASGFTRVVHTGGPL